MLSCFGDFIQHLIKKDIIFRPNTFAKSFYSFSFYLIQSISDITPQINEQIKRKIGETHYIIIDKYINGNQTPNSLYVILCFEQILLIISETNLFILNEYFTTEINAKLLYLSNVQHVFQQNIKNVYDESKENEFFFNEAYNNLEIIVRGSKSISYFWSIIKKSLLFYLLKKSYYKTLQNRIKKFSINSQSSFKFENFDEDKYIILQNIGIGSSSEVKLIYDIENEQFLAGKSIYTIDEENFEFQKREIENLSNISHPFLPKFYGIFNYNQQKIVIIEFINGDTLLSLIDPSFYYKDRIKLTITEKMKIIIQIMFIIEYLHCHNYIYRDLKPNNVMIDKNQTVVLIDFDRMMKSDCIDYESSIDHFFTAPEAREKHYKYASDIYSLGIMIYYILMEKNPEIISDKFNFNDIPDEIIEIKEICQKSTKFNPEERPNIEELISYFFINFYSKMEKDLFQDTLLFLSKSQNPLSQYNLGLMYYNGSIIPFDGYKAFLFFTLAANQDFAMAQYYLGLMNYNGKYFVKDNSKAFHFFQLAAKEYQPAQYYCDLIQQNKENMEFKFIELDFFPEFRTELDSIQIPMFKKIYSKFNFLFLSLSEFYYKKMEISERLIESYLYNTLKEFKFMVIQLITNSIFSKNSDHKDKIYSNHVVDVVICTEGKFFIIESIYKDLIIKIINLTKASIINLSDNNNQDINDEIRSFFIFSSLSLIKNSFFKATIDPIATYLIRRYYYPSYFFKDPSFFIFDPKFYNDDSQILQKQFVSSLFDKKDMSSFINSCQMNNNNNKPNIHYFDENEFIKLRSVHKGKTEYYYLVMHRESLYIFILKVPNYPRETSYNEIDFCSKYSHRCLTRFYGIVNAYDSLYGFIYEFMSNGNLNDLILQNINPISQTYSFLTMNRIYQGINYLHCNSFVHLKLNPTAILIDHDFLPYISDIDSIKMIDGGISIDDSFQNRTYEELLYISPEQYEKKYITFSSNIYSFGRIIYLLFEKNNFFDYDSMESFPVMFHQNDPIVNSSQKIQMLYQLCIKYENEERIKETDIKNILYEEANSLYYLENNNLTSDEIPIHEIIQFIYEMIHLNPVISPIITDFLFKKYSSLIQKAFQINFTNNYQSTYKISNNEVFIDKNSIKNNPQLKTISLSSFTTSICDNAFEDCSFLNQITFELPSFLTFIGSSAFKECSQLSYINIPPSVTEIGKFAFKGCSSLIRIKIPSSITKIEEHTFEKCTSLTEVLFNIPSSVKLIKESAFEKCSSLTNITIPSSVNKIESSSFKGCTSLIRIYIPPSVTEIGQFAFEGCSSITQFTISSSITRIEDHTFQHCSSLIQVSFSIPSSVEYIGSSAFDGCTSLTHLTIPSSVESIMSFAFYKCKSLIQISIPSSVNFIGFSAFKKCKSLNEIIIPPFVKSIGSSTFNKCTSLKEIAIPSSVTLIENCSFLDCSSLIKISIPSTVTSIGSSVFENCISLNKISIPTSLKLIECNVFRNCKSLSKITIPSSVAEIDDTAFKGCSSIKEIFIPSSVTSIGTSAFKECTSLEKISIPSSIIEIRRGAFKRCFQLKNLVFLASVTEIEESLFNECKTLKEISIPSSVKTIESSAFFKCLSLTQVIIPSSVSSIRSFAFKGCSSLKHIFIPSSVTEIQTSAFEDCTSLEDISIPSSVSEIEYGVFKGCSSLTTISIPPSITKIGDYAFTECSSLATISIPSSVTHIGSNSFKGCCLLTQIDISSSLEYIGIYAFQSCFLLNQISLPLSLIKTGWGVFKECGSLMIVSLPSSLSEIEDSFFEKCVLLEEIIIPSSIKLIGSSAFKGCTSLKKIEIPSSVVEIGTAAFKKCISLVEVLIPPSLTEIDDSLFEKCTSLAKVKIPSSITSIGNAAFKGCESLTEIEIPSSVTSIAADAFNECKLILSNKS